MDFNITVGELLLKHFQTGIVVVSNELIRGTKYNSVYNSVFWGEKLCASHSKYTLPTVCLMFLFATIY